MKHNTQPLVIWLNGQRVGEWRHFKNQESFVYDNEWFNNGHVISLSLPFKPNNQAHQGEIVSYFFDNLLPDSDAIRRHLAQRHKTDTTPFQLLSAIGKDCVGAIQLLTPDEEVKDIYSIQGEMLNEAKIAELLRQNQTKNHFSKQGTLEDLRISIAGAQEKTALLFYDEHWYLPKDSTPSTHIFKFPLGLVGDIQADFNSSVENEWLCSKIIAAYGLKIAECDIAQFEEQKVLIVKRFDRRLSTNKSWILRIPQEDFCQVSGISSLRKYQSDGGIGISEIMGFLEKSKFADRDRKNFFKTQILFWLLAAADGHAKNFSIFHRADKNYYLTPLYDVLSFHPYIGTGKNKIASQKIKLAMAVRGQSGNHYLIDKIQKRHWFEQAKRVNFSLENVEEIIEEIIGKTEDVIYQVSQDLPASFPAWLADSIFEGIRKQYLRLKQSKFDKTIVPVSQKEYRK